MNSMIDWNRGVFWLESGRDTVIQGEGKERERERERGREMAGRRQTQGKKRRKGKRCPEKLSGRLCEALLVV